LFFFSEVSHRIGWQWNIPLNFSHLIVETIFSVAKHRVSIALSIFSNLCINFSHRMISSLRQNKDRRGIFLHLIPETGLKVTKHRVAIDISKTRMEALTIAMFLEVCLKSRIVSHEVWKSEDIRLREQFLLTNRKLLAFRCHGSSWAGVGHDSVDSSWKSLLNLLVWVQWVWPAPLGRVDVWKSS
jgi:hypothetical protein